MRILLASALALATVLVHAQAYPTRPIRFVISFGPGSASDALARIAGQELSQSLGQAVVVQAKPGADGGLSDVEVKRAAPDGYTYLFGSNSALVVVPHLRKTPPYDPLTDFTPISDLGDNTFFVVVHPSVPAKSIPELIAYAKAKPNAINYAIGNTFVLVATGMFAASNGIAMQEDRAEGGGHRTAMSYDRRSTRPGSAEMPLGHLASTNTPTHYDVWVQDRVAAGNIGGGTAATAGAHSPFFLINTKA